MRLASPRPATPVGWAFGKRLGLATCLLALAAILPTGMGVGHLTAAAQAPNEWLPVRQVPEYLDDTFTPYMVADRSGIVHTFANQWADDDQRLLAIVYRQWTRAGGWTSPVDILLSPAGEARICGAFVDQAGMMHLTFWGGDAQRANIYYSQAPALIADSARSWSAPQLVGKNANSPSSCALVGDEQGNLVLIYSGYLDGNGVYATQTDDGGSSWSDPISILLTYDPELVPYSLQLVMGPSEQVHAAWNVVTSLGVDMSLHYARLDLASGAWSESITLEEREDENEQYFGPSYPSIVHNGQDVVVMYNSGNPATDGPVDYGRPVQRVRVSSDDGRTWRAPITPFPRHQGRSGEHSLAVDSSGVVHALFVQRIEQWVGGEYTVISGMWHSELRGGQWSEPDRFTSPFSPHDVRAVISQGNVLLATWRQDPGEGQNGVWYSYTLLDAPALPVVPLPSPSAAPTLTPPGSTPTPLPWPAAGSQAGMPGRLAADPAVPLVLGLVPVVLLVAGIILVRQFHFLRRD
jgi:hypothetical protein